MTFSLKPWTLAFILVAFSGCARIRDGSELRGFSDVQDPSGFPASMALEILSKEGATTYCVASFIRSDLLLTAAPCLKDAKKVWVIGSFAPFNSSEADKRVSSVTFTVEGELALAHFPKNTAPLEMVARLSTTETSDGAPLHLIGYLSPPLPGHDRESKAVEKHRVAGFGEGKKRIKLYATAASLLARAAADASVLYNDRFELLGLQLKDESPLGAGEAWFLSINDPQQRSFIDKALKDPIKSLVGTTRAVLTSKASLQCQDNIVRVTLPSGSKPTVVTIAGTCKPLLICREATLEFKGPLSQSSSILPSAAACVSAKSELETAMKALK